MSGIIRVESGDELIKPDDSCITTAYSFRLEREVPPSKRIEHVEWLIKTTPQTDFTFYTWCPIVVESVEVFAKKYNREIKWVLDHLEVDDGSPLLNYYSDNLDKLEDLYNEVFHS